MNDLILKLAKKYFVTIVDDNTISIIVPYSETLNSISKEYNIKLIDTFNGQFNSQGVFNIS